MGNFYSQNNKISYIFYTINNKKTHRLLQELMNQSRILGNLQMSHSVYVDDKKLEKQDQNDKLQQEMLKTLVNYARNSYVATKKKGKTDQIKLDDVKQPKKAKIFHQQHATDLTVSRLPNYNILQVQNISQNKTQCFTCNVFNNTPTQYYVVMEQPCRLIMYKKGTQVVQYSLNFDTIDAQIRAQTSALSDTKYFLLIARHLILKISHQSGPIIKSWYQQLQKIVNKSYGKQFNMNQIAINSPTTFYKTLYCTQDQFTTNCQTGDVLLFQDQHFFAKAQRFILNADYDHVAMIIRDKKYGILMFQANSLSGVSLTPWSCMIKYGWYKYIKRIVWRKLQNVQRTKFFQGIIHKFVKQNLKVNYYISFQKLLSNKSYIGQKEQQKGYFCSQLIATIYKDLQLLTRDKQNKNYIAASKVYPYHFSQKYDLKLEMGNLSKQYQINFNQELLKKSYGEKFIN